MRSAGLLASVLLLLALPHAAAQTPRSGSCEGGIQVDDGSFENGAGSGSVLLFASYVQALPIGGAPLEEVCICWQRAGTDSTIRFNLNVFASEQGAPGELLGVLDNQIAQDVPARVSGRFYNYDVSALGIGGHQEVFVGPAWSPGDDPGFFVCSDENGPGGEPAYGASAALSLSTPPGRRLGQVGALPELRALGIRATVGESQTSCIEDSETLCLSDDRFRVKVQWRSSQGTGRGRAQELTSDTGYFWFFDPDNVELVVKVLDACSFASRFWVFAGGLTNVEVEIAVTDTQEDVTKIYNNPLNTPFRPIQDTAAFATCP